MSHVWNRLPGVAALLLLTIGLFYAGGAFAQTPEAAPALLAHQSALELDGAGVEVGKLVEGGAAYESGEVMEGDVLMRVGRADVSRLGFDQVTGDVGEI